MYIHKVCAKKFSFIPFYWSTKFIPSNAHIFLGIISSEQGLHHCFRSGCASFWEAGSDLHQNKKTGSRSTSESKSKPGSGSGQHPHQSQKSGSVDVQNGAVMEVRKCSKWRDNSTMVRITFL
jgi:hypothetical protein